MSHPIPFRPPTVPIVGQPFTLKNYSLLVQIVCNCDGKEPLLLMGNTVGACPACGRQYQSQGVAVDQQGQIQIRIGMVLQDRAPEES